MNTEARAPVSPEISPDLPPALGPDDPAYRVFIDSLDYLSAADLARVESLEQMDEILGRLERDQPYPGEEAEGPRGRLGGAKVCALPENWLDSEELVGDQRKMLQEAELGVSGG